MTAIDSERLLGKLEAFGRRHDVPAIGGAVVINNGPPIVEVVGRRIRSHPAMVSREDLWHIGSCAKSMTAALVGRFVEAGVIRWETSLPALFEDLDIHPAWGDVSLAQLLTHRSGMPGNLAPSEMRMALSDRRPLTEQRTEVVERALAKPPERIGRFLYSNLGYIVVGAALERLSQRPFEQVLADDLLTPLGIDHFGFGAPPRDQPWGHRPRVGGVGRGPAIDPNDMGPVQPADNPPVMGPAGRLHISLGGWAKFIKMFLVPGDHLLNQSTIDTLTTPTDGPGPRQGMGWAQAATSKIAFGQQGSNRRWVATALVSEDRHAAVMVVCNDGRSRVLYRSASLAAELGPTSA